MLSILGLCIFVVIAKGDQSAFSDYVDELVRNNGFSGRISTNVVEDAWLSLPELVRKYNYPFEQHSVTTEDGYILGVHRIPHGRDANNSPGDKPVVFLMHGLLSSSAENIIMGPGTGLAYLLAEEGFDVWLGNARGNTFSRRHVSLNPDSRKSSFFDFSWDEIGNYDLPAMIDYVLDYTGRSGLHYIGFSQGTTAFFVMGSLRPIYNRKIISMHALAPVAYMAHNKNRLFLALAPRAKEILALGSLLGYTELFPFANFYTKLGLGFCSDRSKFQPLCSEFLFLIGGRNVQQHNATMIPVITGHLPAGAALKQLAHYGQSIVDKEFKRYDYGALSNLLKYGTLSPPRYDLSKISAPVHLYYSQRDPFAEVPDVERLHRELGNPVEKFLVADRHFSHLDFVWGIDAKTLLHDYVINNIRSFEVNKR